MADVLRSQPFSVAGEDVDHVRAAFGAAGFDEASVARAVGAKSIAQIKDVPAEVALSRVMGDSPLHVLIRLFVIGAPVPLAAARSALAPASIERLADGGLLKVRGEIVRAFVKVAPVMGLLVAFDRSWEGDREEPPDHVMGPSDGACLLASLTIRAAGAQCLDLGTGCGFLALLAARTAARVVASDVNPRSRAYVELNARLNGLSNIEAVTGDLFAPVAGRTFDLIFSNPPYVISPENRLVYMSGGMTGDAFCRRIVAEVGPFLREGAYFQMIFHWAEREKEDWTAHLSSWFTGEACDAWVLRSSSTDPTSYALTWMDIGRRADKAEPERLARWLQYYQEEDIAAIGAGVLTLKKRPEGAGQGWFRGMDGPPSMLGPCGGAVLGRMSALDFLSKRKIDQALFDSVFKVSPDVRLTQECEPSPGGWTQATAHIRVREGLAYVEEVDTYVAELLVACDGERTLRAAVEKTLERICAEPDSAPEETADIVRQLVEEGFLVPVSS